MLMIMFVVQAKPLQESVKDSTPLSVEWARLRGSMSQVVESEGQ